MRQILLAAATIALVATASPALARQSQGYAVRATVVLAGPDRRYPRVRGLRANSGVLIYGCLRDRSWCDVGYRTGRGWVPGGDIVIDYRGRRRGISAGMGISILAFSFGSYWDSNYRSQPFYAERPRWEQQSAGYYGNAGPVRGDHPGQPRANGGNRGPGAWQQPMQPQVAPHPNNRQPQGGPHQGGAPHQNMPQQTAPQQPGPGRGNGGQGGGHGNGQGGHPERAPGNGDHQPHQ